MRPLYNYIDAEIAKISTELNVISQKYDNLLKNHEQLCENVRNNNVMLEGYGQLCKNFEDLSENVRNNNAVLEGYKQLCENFEQLSENIRNVNAMLEGYDKVIRNVQNLNLQINNFESDIERMRFIVSKLDKEKKPITLSTQPQNNSTLALSSSQNEYMNIDYFDFENYFRGSRAIIKERQKEYLKYFENCKNILDIGCGRGEFLELMRDSGFSAIGVDTYEDFAEYCESLGLDAVCADGIEYLSSIESIDGIFVGQVVEHLTTAQVISLIETAYEKLSDGGVLIMETPNPKSLSTYVNAFYLDPSHTKPVHPEFLKYLLRNAGYKDIEILFTDSSKPDITIPPIENENEFNHSMETVQQILFGSQDYAVIARK